MATQTTAPATPASLTTLEKLERLEARVVQLDDEMAIVSGKTWEIRRSIYAQALREIKKLENQLARESVTDLLPA